MPSRDEVLNQAIATFKEHFHKPNTDRGYDEALSLALAPVIAEVRKAAMDSLIEDVDALDGARHLLMWIDGYPRPTHKNLRTYCRLMGKTPPDDCEDIDHVPPKALRTQWILKAIIKEHRRLHLAK
ncbi:hypothetical protein [Galbibacter sp. BG1]